VVATESSAQR